MRAAFGEIGDMRLHVMAAITMADETARDRRSGIAALEEELAKLRDIASTGDERQPADRGPSRRRASRGPPSASSGWPGALAREPHRSPAHPLLPRTGARLRIRLFYTSPTSPPTADRPYIGRAGLWGAFRSSFPRGLIDPNGSCP